jgi:hypothetical protein
LVWVSEAVSFLVAGSIWSDRVVGVVDGVLILISVDWHEGEDLIVNKIIILTNQMFSLFYILIIVLNL